MYTGTSDEIHVFMCSHFACKVQKQIWIQKNEAVTVSVACHLREEVGPDDTDYDVHDLDTWQVGEGG